MNNTIKVFHYCYFVEFVKWKDNTYRIDHSKITKNCFLGFIDTENEEIKIPNWNLTFYYDDCPIKESLVVNFNNKAEDSGIIMYDYFTIDEVNGYDEFLKSALREMTSLWITKRKVAEIDE